jgi:hypothetical protein
MDLQSRPTEFSAGEDSGGGLYKRFSRHFSLPCDKTAEFKEV